MKSDIIKDVVSDIDIQIVRGKDVFVRTLRSGLGSLSLSLCLLICETDYRFGTIFS